MYRHAFAKSGFDGCFSQMKDWPVSKALPILKLALEDMKANPKEYEQHNPPNGWGGYPGAVEFLEHLVNACEAIPEGTLYVS